MKRLSLWLIILSLGVPSAWSQDAATEERLNKLSGQIEDLIAAQKDQKDRVSAILKELASVREQASKPVGNYAAQEDLKSLRESLKEMDRKRMEDNEKLRTELLRLGKILSSPPPQSKRQSGVSSADSPPVEKEKATSSDKGFEYTIQKNDTLSIIVQAYKEKNIKVTTDQILKANPNLKANQLRVGQKIFIPAPSNGGVNPKVEVRSRKEEEH